MLTCDVVIVGGGIVGRACALATARAGMKVTLLDPGPDLRAATGASGAMLGAFGEVTSGGADPATDGALEGRVRAARMYSDWLASLTQSQVTPPMTPGTLVVASVASRLDRANLVAMSAALAHYGEQWEAVAGDVVDYLRPAHDTPLLDALWLPREGSVDVGQVMDALWAELTAHSSVNIVGEAARTLRVSDGRIAGVDTTGTSLDARWTVIAAGVASTSLLATVPEAAQAVLPLLEGKGTSLVLRSRNALPHVVRTPNREFACGVHLVPRAGSLVYLGATNRVASVAGATGAAAVGEVHYLIETAIRQLDTRLTHADIVSVQSGCRPLSADGNPLVGVTAMPGLVVATGTYRNGVLLAPYVGEIVAREITMGCGEAGNPYSPIGRDQPAAKSHAEIKDVLRRASSGLLAMMLEPGGTLPYGRIEEVSELLEVLVPLLADSRSPAVARLCRDIIGTFPVEEMVPELLILLRMHFAEVNGLAVAEAEVSGRSL